MPKFYAVRVGRQIGIYNTWEECKKQTKDYPNARYKRFEDLKDAEDFAYIQPSSSTVLPPQKSNSDSARTKGKKRAYGEVEDESSWDVVYTDGACKGNGTDDAFAGIGVWWGCGDPRNIAERCPGSQTNNRAELIAILRVLEMTPLSRTPLLIKTDSTYSIDCFQKWIHNWEKNNWKNSAGKNVKNEGIIRCIYSHLQIRSKNGQNICLQHVKGHNGEVGNEGADALANEGTLKPQVQERDWESLEVQLLKVLDNTDSQNTATNAVVEVKVSVAAELELQAKSRKLKEDGFHSYKQRDKASVGSLNPKSNSSAFRSVPDELRTGVDQVKSTTLLGKVISSPSKINPLISPTNRIQPQEVRVSSMPMPSDISANSPLMEDAQNLVGPVGSQSMERTGLVPPTNCSTSQFLAGPSISTSHFHVDPLTQSPVKVLYAAPPLVPVRVEDVNFEDYADCLLDDADLALELSD